MDEAAFALLEYLASRVLLLLGESHRTETDLDKKNALAVQINELTRLWDEARHEQKGGA